MDSNKKLNSFRLIENTLKKKMNRFGFLLRLSGRKKL